MSIIPGKDILHPRIRITAIHYVARILPGGNKCDLTRLEMCLCSGCCFASVHVMCKTC
jgi:hypothetical protein